MDRHKIIPKVYNGTIALTLLAFASYPVKGTESATVEKTNIILINIDDMGWRDVGFMGLNITTPQILTSLHVKV